MMPCKVNAVVLRAFEMGCRPELCARPKYPWRHSRDSSMSDGRYNPRYRYHALSKRYHYPSEAMVSVCGELAFGSINGLRLNR